MIKVAKVVREENKVVQRVVLVLDGYMELTFERINGKPKEVSRIIPEGRLYDSFKLYITPDVYKELMKRVYAIFTQRKSVTV